MSEVVIRRAEWSDRERIFEFYTKAYPDWESRIPHRWDWQVTYNPYRPEGPPPVWLALLEDGTVIGQTMVVMEPMRLAGEHTLTGWSVDAYVCEEYRGQGIGKALKETMNREFPQVMSISMANAIRHINLTQGALNLPDLETYLLNVGPNNLQESFSRSNRWQIGKLMKLLGIHIVITQLINSRNRKRRLKERARQPELEAEKVSVFPPEVDQLWEKYAPCFTGAMERTYRYLNWKYRVQPHVNYEFILFRRQEDLVGYVVLRKTKRRGFVVDFLMDPDQPEMILTVLDYAVEFFLKEGIQEIRVGSSFPPYLDCLRKIGWPRPIQKRTPMLHIQSEYDADLLMQGHWLFSLGDHDQQQ